jgi:hypothetical protein
MRGIKHIRGGVLFTTILMSSLLSAWADRPAPERPIPLPTATVKNRTEPSIVGAVEKMWGTEIYPSPDPAHWETGAVSVTKIEKEAIRNFIEKNSTGHIYIVRYGLSDPELLALLKKALAKGLKITLIADLNRALEAPKGETKPRSDFAKLARLKNRDGTPNEMAKIIDELIAAGCKFNNGDCRILSQPVFPRVGDEMISILHDKALLLVANEGQPNETIEFYLSTANFSDVTRINTLMKIKEKLLAQHYLQIARAMADTFARGGTIRDVPEIPPLRVVDPDDPNGAFIEMAETFGRHNTNERIRDVFARAAKDPNFIIEDVYLNHFVVTHRPTVEALVEAMKIQKDFRVRGLVDGQFVKQDSQGLAATLEGWDVFRKWGGPMVGFPYDINSRVDLYAYQAPATNLSSGETLETTDEEDGHLTQKLQHNKTTVIFVRENGKRWAYVFFGSFNLSGHFQNSEYQLMMKVPAESFIAQHAKWDFENIIRTQPEYAVELGQAVVRNLLADYGDQDRQVVKIPDIERAKNAILNRNYTDLFALIREIYDRKSTMSDRKTKAELDAEIADMEAYLAWYAKNTQPSELGDYYRLRKFVSLMFVKEEAKKLDALNLEKAVRGALWRPNMDPAELTRLTAESWKILKLPGAPATTAQREQTFTRNVTTAATPPVGAIMRWVFDWDDNIAFMPTKIYLFEKGTGRELEISTRDYAENRKDLEKGIGKYANYEVRSEKITGSFRRFENGIDGNYFLQDLASMVEGPEFGQRKGPAWNDMIEALNNEMMAKQFMILTARSNHPQELYEGLQYLQKKGIIKYLPPLANIRTASNPKDPSGAKALEFVQMLDNDARVAINNLGPEVLDRDAIRKVRTHLIGYSDDDWNNFEAVMNAAIAGVKAHKWSNIKIVLKYTGHDPRGANLRSVVIQSNGELRASIKGENDTFRVKLEQCERELALKPAA